MIQKLKNQGDILFSILNTTYEFLGVKGGEEMIKEWCYYVAEHGLWNGIIDAEKRGGLKGVKKFWDDFLKAERMPSTHCKTEIKGNEFIMTIKKCHSQETVRKTGANLYGNACLHCLYICEKMAELIKYDLKFEYDPERGKCIRIWKKQGMR